MDGQTDGWKEGRMNGWTNGWKDGWTNRPTYSNAFLTDASKDRELRHYSNQPTDHLTHKLRPDTRLPKSRVGRQSEEEHKNPHNV